MESPGSKDVFFLIPLGENDKDRFAVMWKGTLYTFNSSPQGHKHSPATAHKALAKVLAEIPGPPAVTGDRCINETLTGGQIPEEEVRQATEKTQGELTALGLDTPPRQSQGAAQEAKFQGIWWFRGAASVPPHTLEKGNRDRKQPGKSSYSKS